MANAVATPSLVDNWHDSKRQHVVGTVAITNFNYVTNGLPISWFTTIPLIKSDVNPVFCYFAGLNGFVYSWDYTNFTIRIYQTGSSLSGALQEMTGGSPLTAGVSTDTIRFYAGFKLI